MNALTSFHFLQPWALLAALPLSALAIWALQQQQGQRVWQRLFDAPLLPRFLSESIGGSTRSAMVLAVIVSLLLAVALAQPVWRQLPQPVFQAQSALVIALDLSASMDAKDTAPSRLKQAKFKIRDLLAARKEGQTALIVYAGDAFTVTPLTEDSETIISQLAALEPGIMPLQGSRPERALALADKLLSQAGINGGDLLLIGDELQSEKLDSAIDTLRSKGRRLSVLALGTEAGAPVPGLKYRDGKPVIAAMAFAPMQEAASQGGGMALKASADSGDIQQLSALFAQRAQEQSPQQTDRNHDQWVAEGPWFILLALPFLLPLFRRGVLSIGLLTVAGSLVLTPAQPVVAADLAERWQSLWQTPDQQAMRAWRDGDKATAAGQFESPEWQQASRYSQNDFQGALDSLVQPESADQWYNRANAHARLGQFDKAVAAYDEALKLNPDNSDARANRDLVEQAKKQLEQQSQNQQDQNGQQDQQGSSDQSEQAQQGDQGQPSEGSDQSQGANSQGGESSESGSESSEAGESDEQSGKNQQGSEAESRDTDSAQQGGEGESSKSDADKSAVAAGEDDEQQARQQQFSEAVDQAEQNNSPQGAVTADPELQPMDEQQQAREQLLNRVVDDPAGLWRRKFLYQYQQQAEPLQPGDKPW